MRRDLQLWRLIHLLCRKPLQPEQGPTSGPHQGWKWSAQPSVNAKTPLLPVTYNSEALYARHWHCIAVKTTIWLTNLEIYKTMLSGIHIKHCNKVLWSQISVSNRHAPMPQDCNDFDNNNIKLMAKTSKQWYIMHKNKCNRECVIAFHTWYLHASLESRSVQKWKEAAISTGVRSWKYN